MYRLASVPINALFLEMANNAPAHHPSEKLSAMFMVLGFDLEISEDVLAGSREEECEIHARKFFSEMTNGEYIWLVYEALRGLTDSTFEMKWSDLHGAVIGETIDHVKAHFFDEVLPSDDKKYQKRSKSEVWELYKLCAMADDELSLEKADRDDWEHIFDAIEAEFTEDNDWEYCFHFSELEPYPHQPTFQEYRQARYWLLGEYSRLQKRE